MATFPHDCPHCGTKNSGFEIIYKYSGAPGGSAWFLKCSNQNCRLPATAVAPANKSNYEVPDLMFIKDFFPAPPRPDIPEHMPETVERYYRQAESIIQQHADAAGAMYRKALDVGLKLKFPDSPSNLAPRIKKLVKDGMLTEELGDFAHHVRLGGNDATHDEDPFTVDEAKELGFLTKMVMTYIYTLPEMIRLRQERVDAEKAAAEE